MNKNINYLPFIVSIILVNAAGFLLRYFEFDTYIILLGFRFHISFIIPFILCFSFGLNDEIKNIFIQSRLKGWFSILFLVLIPVLVVIVSGYYFFKLDFTDPEYFYEFGLSSIVDYPVYLLWNFPQIAALFIVIKFYSGEKKIFIKSFIFLFCLFLFEFIPIEKLEIKYFSLIPFLLAVLIAALSISRFKNIYWFAIIIFTMLWINPLAFGSESQTMIKLLFARQYSSWEGFFSIDKKITMYILPVQLLLTLLVLFLRSSKVHNTKS